MMQQEHKDAPASESELLSDALNKMLEYPEIQQAKLAYEAMLRSKTAPDRKLTAERVYDTIILSG
jgi:hypothetical protein